MAVVGFVMMTFVLPKLTAMYSDFGVTLPLPTRVLIGFVQFLLINGMCRDWWHCSLIIYLFNRWYKTETGQRIVAGLLLRTNSGRATTKMMITDFVRTLSLLLGSGVTLLQALLM